MKELPYGRHMAETAPMSAEERVDTMHGFSPLKFLNNPIPTNLKMLTLPTLVTGTLVEYK